MNFQNMDIWLGNKAKRRLWLFPKHHQSRADFFNAVMLNLNVGQEKIKVVVMPSPRNLPLRTKVIRGEGVYRKIGPFSSLAPIKRNKGGWVLLQPPLENIKSVAERILAINNLTRDYWRDLTFKFLKRGGFPKLFPSPFK